MHSALAHPSISGTTDVYLIVGDPVAQVQAPALFNAVFARTGINAVLVPTHVAPQHLTALVKGAFGAANIKGLWAAIPHKTALVHLLDACSPMGRAAGAVNAVRRNSDGRLEGALFDGEGLVGALNHFGMSYQQQRVLILGAGGGASAIAASLACTTPGAAAHVALYDPLPGKADAVARHIGRHSQAEVVATPTNDPVGYDLVINASPLGLQAGDAQPCDVQRLEPHASVMDIVMKNQPTPWVRAARGRGLNAQPGFEMLVQQAPLYLDFFGYTEAADLVRRDTQFLRAQIDPTLF
ncbi:shikimate dehydrogenase [Rhodoferax saidenbachensis]|uniref:Shikimate dehydrogenase n=1 Tax=Rhodoferax saidenbachensis TaxID=1484693 RepID=A0ABU1ZIW7_9BURK|nr:shikimate dehydrogenase [Rhodoferax saidenbachensis]MDR7304840.1 shikimate dehydrogenase [Rhodoferax saidenbachensis]